MWVLKFAFRFFVQALLSPRMACSSCSFLRLLAGEAFWDSATRTDWVERMVEVTTWRQNYELGLYLLVNLTWVTGSTISVVIALPPRVSRIWLVAKLVTVDVTVSVCVRRDVCS